MSHFACSGIRKLSEILWASASHTECSTTANMQASTGQHTGSLKSTGKTHTPNAPSAASPRGELGNLPLIGTLKRIHIRRREEEKKETGHKQRYLWRELQALLLCALRLPVRVSMERWSEGKVLTLPSW